MKLEERFERARVEGDLEGLARSFAEAADRSTDPDAEAFLLTQANAYGLEAGLEQCRAWHARLVELGAERT